MTTESTSHNTHRSLTLLKLFNFSVYGSVAVLFTFFPLYFMEKGLSSFQIGMVMAGGPFISIFANPFWGYWSDRTQNIKRTIMMMMIGNLIVVQAVFQLDAFVLIYSMMLLFFFFQSPLFSQGNSLILNTIEGTSHKFGAFRLWGSLGFAVMAAAAGPVVAEIGVGNLWIVYSVMLLISLSFAIGMPRGNSPSASKSKFTNNGYRNVFVNKFFLAFVLLGVLISVPNSMNFTFISLYIQELGGSAVLIGWSAFLSAIFEVPIFLLFDRYLKKDTRTMFACLVFVSLLFSVRWLLMAIATGPVQLIFIQILHCVTFGGYYYVGTSLTSHLIPSQYRASGQAAFALTWGGISGILAGFIGGWMYQSFGASTMYSVNSIITLAGVAGFLIMWVKVKSVETTVAKDRIQQTR
jgi:PPP family 3-phenylpropionic acid transporter